MGLAASLLVGGTILGAAAQLQAGRVAEAQAEGEQAQAEYNQKVSEQNAEAARRKASFDQRRQLKAGQRAVGTLRAKLGASGAAFEGAPEALISEQLAENALENALIGFEGLVTAGRFRSQASLFGMEAELAGMRAGAAPTAAAIGAGATLLTGFGTAKALSMFGGKRLSQQGIAKGFKPSTASTISGKTKSGGFIFGR